MIEAIVTLDHGSTCTPEPIVRCRDCIAYSLLADPDGERPGTSWCELLEVKTRPNGFCHRAARRKE